MHSRVEATTVDIGVRGIARGEQNWQPWPAPANLIRKGTPIHFSGQNDISKKEFDLRMLLKYLQRLASVASLEDTVSEIPQCLGGVRS
jgi:hypothetical protein